MAVDDREHHSRTQTVIKIARAILEAPPASTRVTSEEVKEAVSKAAVVYPGLSAESMSEASAALEASFSIYSDDYVALVDEGGHLPWLKEKKADIEWKFWRRYLEYLGQKLAPDTINKLDNLTDDVLDYLIDPESSGAWDKRGMVVGQVQSGKTGNYIGLINKAADAGFKFIIVLAGLHNDLRAQTQIRIDEGFLGFSTRTALNYQMVNHWVGVGTFDRGPAANALTTSDLNGDFTKQVAQGSGVNVRGESPTVVVAKKNVRVLERLLSWLGGQGEADEEGFKRIRDVPLLLIDDEADHASINTSKEDVSRTNEFVRALLAMFEKSAYVGYTATPFANVFIEMEGESTRPVRAGGKEFALGEDLFPRDFIINIPPPSNYVGPARVFGVGSPESEGDGEAGPLDIVRPISDYGDAIPDRHKITDPLPDSLPPSLRRAVLSFVLSCAARRARGQTGHNSMLVHVTRFVIWQDAIAKLIDDYLKDVQRKIEFRAPDILSELEAVWKGDFVRVTADFLKRRDFADPAVTALDWSDIRDHLHAAASPIEVRAIHGTKSLAGLSHHNISPLDYHTSAVLGKSLSVIAVGGNKLSRGLTLEGLTVSYYLRASKMYDTLMQMGRWFGYRPGYADLCRLFTSDELIDWYRHITVATEEMRREFDDMFLMGKTPTEYQIKIRTHPGVLKISATNKLRHKQTMWLSYSGELEQTYRLALREPVVSKNKRAVADLLASLGSRSPGNGRGGDHFVWEGNGNYAAVTEFLRSYDLPSEVVDPGKMADYVEKQGARGDLVDWTVVLVNSSSASEKTRVDAGDEVLDVGMSYRTHDDRPVNSTGREFHIRKSNIISPDHESLDLSDADYERALSATVADWRRRGEKGSEPKRPSGHEARVHRGPRRGLLLIYPLRPYIKGDGDTRPRPMVTGDLGYVDGMAPVYGFAVSFPYIDGDEKVEYAVHDQFRSQFDYDPDDFESDEEE